jgi:hypothetical protein
MFDPIIRHVLHSLYYKAVTANLDALITDPKQADKNNPVTGLKHSCVPPGSFFKMEN